MHSCIYTVDRIYPVNGGRSHEEITYKDKESGYYIPSIYVRKAIEDGRKKIAIKENMLRSGARKLNLQLATKAPWHKYNHHKSLLTNVCITLAAVKFSCRLSKVATVTLQGLYLSICRMKMRSEYILNLVEKRKQCMFFSINRKLTTVTAPFLWQSCLRKLSTSFLAYSRRVVTTASSRASRPSMRGARAKPIAISPCS